MLDPAATYGIFDDCPGVTFKDCSDNNGICILKKRPGPVVLFLCHYL